MKIALKILANAGYSKNQVKGVTLKELRQFIDELIEDYGEYTEVVTKDEGNEYGADIGILYLDVYDDDEEEYDEEDD